MMGVKDETGGGSHLTDDSAAVEDDEWVCIFVIRLAFVEALLSCVHVFLLDFPHCNLYKRLYLCYPTSFF